MVEMIGQPNLSTDTSGTVEALSSRQVHASMPVEPWPKRWAKVIAHLRQMHPETTPAGAPINPGRLAGWHASFHQGDDAWSIEESAHPHLHANLIGRLRYRWEMRP